MPRKWFKCLSLLLFIFLCGHVFGETLLFVSENASQADIYQIEEDGSGLKPLTDNKDYELMGTVSFDGTKVVYAASPYKEGTFGKPQIFLLEIGGGKPKQLTHNEQENFSPCFSPDGRQIAFSMLDEQDNADIYLIDSNGENLRQMTKEPTYEANPSWSRQGDILLYQAENSGGSRLMQMGAQGISSLTQQEEGFAFSPAWSPTGDKFVYGLANNSAKGMSTDIVVADATGKTLQRLTGKDVIRSHPHLSSDGAKIVYEEVKEDLSGIFIVDINGENAHEIGPAGNHNFAPVWIGQALKTNPAKSLQVQINDDLGNVIQIDPENLPERVVSLAPSLTEIIFALGEAKCLKGVTLRSEYPPQAKLLPLVGSYNQPDWEKIKNIKPQYVLLNGSLQEKFVPQIKELGAIPVLFKPADVTEILQLFRKMSLLLTGSKQAGETLATQVAAEMAELTKLASQIDNPKKVYLEINGPQNLYTVGQGSFMNDLMKQANVINVFGEKMEAYPQITDEAVIAANPDLIIIDHPLQYKGGVQKRPGWDKIKAVRDNQVYDAQDFDVLVLDRPGPRIPQALKSIIELAYPELTGHK